MKITKIHIKNYRSCLSTEFDPNELLSALIGPNSSGKTNILCAIRLLTLLMSVRRRRYRAERPITSSSEIKVWYDWKGNRIIYTATLSIVTDEQNNDEIISSDETWYMFDVTGSKKRIKLPLVLLSDYFAESKYRQDSDFLRRRNANFFRYVTNQGLTKKSEQAFYEVVRFLSRLKYYSASQFTNPSNCPISFEAECTGKVRHGIGIRGHKKLLYDMYDEYRSDSPGYRQFKSLIGPDGIGLINKIEFNEIETSSSDYSVMTGGRITKKEKVNLLVIPSFTIDKNNLSPSQLSEGTFKTIALLFYLVTDRSSLLMIEEPEVCVHHGLLESIIEMIKIYSNEKQIIISTHSDAVLDSLDIKNIFKVSRGDDKGTVVTGLEKSMKGTELKALKDFLHNEGSLGEFWKHGDLEDV